MKINESPKAVRVRSDVGVPASRGVLGATGGIDAQVAAPATSGAAFGRAAAHTAAPFRTWSVPIT